MPSNRNGGAGCAIALLVVGGLFFGVPVTMILAAPALAARIEFSGAHSLAPYLREWLWASIASPLLAVALVRLVLPAKGRLRSRSVPAVKRWLGLLARAAFVLGVINVAVFVQLTDAGRTDHVIANGLPLFTLAAVLGIATLIAISVFDRRTPVSVQEIHAATAEAKRALSRVRAENERVRRQAEQVQARLAKLRARAAGPADGSTHSTSGRARDKKNDRRQSARSDLDFHALRIFHRESYLCADTAHVAYQSAQTSLRTMSYVVRRAQIGTQIWLPTSRASKVARAEMRDAATHLARSHGELRTQVDQGLGLVRTLNANTSDLKHEIRDNYGEDGRSWFEALEQRIAEARAERRASRIG
ncbi:hypothetical protein [Streptomyces hygroscopicus]|uniref:hypothetical protein n=1 Tax=Streptomyces hygroscopicus TaxID=1912 RepID=UPI0022408C72|nr:hypothetical protein [Streptomyces hygroscopicus]